MVPGWKVNLYIAKLEVGLPEICWQFRMLRPDDFNSSITSWLGIEGKPFNIMVRGFSVFRE